MKISDYIVEFLINQNITDVFGYPGGMVTHLMDSFSKYEDQIQAHLNYHEQASAFAACGYAQVTMKPGVAYATSGPGATNLITGIANAYFDSIPCIFITGQVNTFEGKKGFEVRQKGFQETDIVSMVEPVTKAAFYIKEPDDIPGKLEEAYTIAIKGRPGPVLLDIPMNVQRAEISTNQKGGKVTVRPSDADRAIEALNTINKWLKQSKRPLILAGAGVAQSGMTNAFRKMIEQLQVPVVTSMLGRDLLPADSCFEYGFIGAYGHRAANVMVSKCDLLITMGSRIDCRQTGATLADFAEHAKILRIDIDAGEMTNNIHEDEIDLHVDLKQLIPLMDGLKIDNKTQDWWGDWRKVCNIIWEKLEGIDDQPANRFIEKISEIIPDGAVITTDVGQNQVWVAQSFKVKEHQRILFSGGHGAMGYSIPAAIGAYYATKKTVYAFVGDGGFMMNLQELEFIKREKLPIKIIVLDNQSLGMIRHFQEMYFDSNYYQTKEKHGYLAPESAHIMDTFGMDYCCINDMDGIRNCKEFLLSGKSAGIEIRLGDTTYVYPKLQFGKKIDEQEPALDKNLVEEIRKL